MDQILFHFSLVRPENLLGRSPLIGCCASSASQCVPGASFSHMAPPLRFFSSVQSRWLTVPEPPRSLLTVYNSSILSHRRRFSLFPRVFFGNFAILPFFLPLLFVSQHGRGGHCQTRNERERRCPRARERRASCEEGVHEARSRRVVTLADQRGILRVCWCVALPARRT